MGSRAGDDPGTGDSLRIGGELKAIPTGAQDGDCLTSDTPGDVTNVRWEIWPAGGCLSGTPPSSVGPVQVTATSAGVARPVPSNRTRAPHPAATMTPPSTATPYTVGAPDRTSCRMRYADSGHLRHRTNGGAEHCTGRGCSFWDIGTWGARIAAATVRSVADTIDDADASAQDHHGDQFLASTMTTQHRIGYIPR